MCERFRRLWASTELPKNTLARNHRYAIETYEVADGNTPTFQRLDTFMAKQPPRHPARPCRCGKNDRWHCWHEVVTAELLGESRISRTMGPWGWDDE
jgi:hypothetical protein